MKQQHYKRLLRLLVLGCPLMLASCFNSDYDFKKVDATLGFGGEQLTLPGNNSTDAIILDDLLKIEGSDLISVAENGDYRISKTPNSVEPVKVTIEPIKMTQDMSAGQSIEIDIPQEVLQWTGQVIDLTAMGIDIHTTQPISLLEYDFDAPEAVKSLEYVGLDNNSGTLTLDVTIPSDIKRFDYLYINLPRMLDMTCENMPDAFDATTNQLRIDNYRPTGNLQLRFHVSRINSEAINSENMAVLENRKFRLKAAVELGFKIGEISVPSSTKILLAGNAAFSDLTITSAKGVFDPEIKLTDAGTVNITSIPEFLQDEEVVTDLDNPLIWLTIHSTMPLGGIIEARLNSDTFQGSIELKGNDAIQVKASPDGITETETKVLICRHNPGIMGAEYQIIEKSDLSRLITKLHENMEIRFTVTKAQAAAETATVLMGHEYQLTPKYRFEAELAFGPQAVIVYSKTENGWNKDIDKLALSNDAYVHMTGKAINQIPADLTLQLTPIDINGQEVSGLQVELIKNSVPGSIGSAQEPTEPNIEVKISDKTGNALRRLDGVVLKLKAVSNEQLRGVTLNKTSQTLILKDINVQLVGKIIYDAN